jgi:hypothetical protein
MTLIVDYGLKRVILNHGVWVSRDFESREAKLNWCEETFKTDTWWYHFADSTLYFKRKKDLMWFNLRFPC